MREERFQIVSINDDAIDIVATTPLVLAEYARTRDMSKLRFKPNSRPMVFSVREISRMLWMSYIEDAPNDGVKRARCFMCGVTSVKNLRQDDGTYLETWEPPMMQSGEHMRVEALERFYPDVITEIGEVVRVHSFLAPWTERSYLLLPSSREQLDDRLRRLAAASPSLPVSSNGSRSPGDLGSTPATAQPATPSAVNPSAEPSESPTDATATATPSAAA